MLSERCEISILLNKDYSFREIADALERSVSTISDEIREGSVKGKYDPKQAHHKAYVRRHYASFRGQKIVSNKKLHSFVESNLLDGQSSEAIAGRIKHQEKDLPNVSKNTIYRYLRGPYGKILGMLLKKKKRPQERKKVTKLKDRTFIAKRPKVVNRRQRVGDVEADFIVSGRGGKGVLLTVVCRKIRIPFFELIPDVSIDNVHVAFERIKRRFPEMKTATIDNDILFRMHKTLEKLLNVKIYFCDPYSSWQKGSIENVNKFVRKFIPKGSDLSKYDQEYISMIEKKCNQRFMKCLKYKTPAEKLSEHRQRKNKKTASRAVRY